jgi:hypothetical protein
LELPVPWADREDQSWLVTAEELHELLDANPLEIVAWSEGQAALDTIADTAKSLPDPPPHPQLGLGILMPDFEARMTGLARNVAAHKIALAQAVAKRRD